MARSKLHVLTASNRMGLRYARPLGATPAIARVTVAITPAVTSRHCAVQPPASPRARIFSPASRQSWSAFCL